MKKTFIFLVALLVSFISYADEHNPKTKLVIISQSAGSTVPPNNIGNEATISGEYDENTLFINVENYTGNVTVSIHRNSASSSLITYTERVYDDTTLEVDLTTLPQAIYVVKITLQNGDVYSGLLLR